MWLSHRTLGGLMLLRFGLGLLCGSVAGLAAVSEGVGTALWMGVGLGILVMVLGRLVVDERELREVNREKW